MKKNIKEILRENNVTVGTWMQIASTDVAEILSNCNFDWIALDLEHGVFSNENLINCVRAIELRSSVPFVRIGEQDEKVIKTCLEAGAKGIIIPMISNADQLKSMISFTKYPPEGRRGVGFSRANIFGANFSDYYNSINDQITVVAQIESIEAVNNLDEIISVEGLDAIMVGPYDLSASMGQAGVFDNDKFINVMNDITNKVKESNVKMGVHVVNPVLSDLDNAIKNENKFIAYGIDALFLRKQASSFTEVVKR